MKNKVVTRFAPSPTGWMHIGGVRTALYAWLFARKHGGTFILRIEDTDKDREVEGSIEHIIKSLKWLGIEWNEGPDIGGIHAPYIQSERLDSYKGYAQVLIDKGLAYADPYTEEEVEAFRKEAEATGKPFLYRNHRPENPPAWDGSTALRLKVKEIRAYEWHDLVRGTLSAGPEALDDIILIKSDGYPTYNFAHIIDDLEMGVTHIMRADEFIASVPKFLSIYDALEIERPAMATLPPIMAPDGKKKLGKRDGAKDILEYSKEGYLPEAMMNFLAFIGWNPGNEREIFTPAELIAEFDITKIHTSGGKFNEEKLNWFNREHIKRLSPERLSQYADEFLPKQIKALPQFSADRFSRIIPVITERISKFSDLSALAEAGELQYFFEQPTYAKEGLFWKESKDESKLKEKFEKVLTLLAHIPEETFTAESTKESLMPYAEEVGRGEVLWPMRYALSGRDKSPDPFMLAGILGKAETAARLLIAKDMLE